MLLVTPILTFLFLYSIMALIRLGINFLRALLSNPPKLFKLTVTEVAVYGIFLSYVITFLIHF